MNWQVGDMERQPTEIQYYQVGNSEKGFAQ